MIRNHKRGNKLINQRETERMKEAGGGEGRIGRKIEKKNKNKNKRLH